MGRRERPCNAIRCYDSANGGPRQELPSLELEVLERWRERDVFANRCAARAARAVGVLRGSPDGERSPGSHHVLSRVFKDIYPRYKTMRGYRVERKGGWDCHGLPVEIGVEKELGIASKAEIEEYDGSSASTRSAASRCSSTWRSGTGSPSGSASGWTWRTPIARWTRTTSSRCGGRSREIDQRGLLYEGHKVVPYCPRCGTALSSHEVALGYEDVVDPSVYLKLPTDSTRASALLIWTTTPWTLPGNVAVAVAPKARMRACAWARRLFVLAEARVRGGARRGRARSSSRFPAAELVGALRATRGPIFTAERPFARRACRSSRATS